MIKLEDSITTVFFDFDGVIKDSLEVKSVAFEKIFLPFGRNIAQKVKEHHEKNGGISRFVKLPIYLEWANQQSSASFIDEYAKKFSSLVVQEVIRSDWVPGILEFMNNNQQKKLFLITATPQNEIEKIVCELGIHNIFKRMIGSPTEKKDAIKRVLTQYSIDPKKALMIGDSIGDYESALVNNLSFILRRTNLNKGLQQELNCRMINDFL
jgi:HAD superfamily hydrolase (TIGR01549 family)